MRAFLAISLALCVSLPLSVFGKSVAGDHEFRLSPLERQDRQLVLAMTGGMKREAPCGTFVSFFFEPVTHAEQVLFAVARPTGEPFQVIGRRAKDIVFRNAQEGEIPTVVGTFLSDGTVTRYTLYLPESEFLAVRECLKPRKADDDRDL